MMKPNMRISFFLPFFFYPNVLWEPNIALKKMKKIENRKKK